MVVVHGIGNQQPMDTVSALVANVFGKTSDLTPPARVERRLDRDAEYLDLHRPVLIESRGWPRTDFFELYWQPTFGTGETGAVLRWMVRLLLTNARGSQLRRVVWTVRAIIALAALVVAAIAAACWLLLDPENPYVRWVLTAVPVALALGALRAVAKKMASSVLTTSVADAQRWFNPAIADYVQRDKVRRDARDLLLTLHRHQDRNEEPLYDRIIIVAHSLGSVIAYDAIRLVFDELRQPREDGHGGGSGELADRQPKAWNFLTAVPGKQDPPRPLPAGRDYHAVQTELQKEQLRMGVPWRVSDFITLGSPLTHAQDLLATKRESFESRKEEQELPACPPLGEQQNRESVWSRAGRPVQAAAGADGSGPVAFYRTEFDGPLIAHEASPFATTRWTNLYFPLTRWLGGDPVGGPVAPVFGRGVVDIPVEISAPRKSRDRVLRTPVAAHTRYWRRDSPGHEAPTKDSVAVLRHAIGLRWADDDEDVPRPPVGRDASAARRMSLKRRSRSRLKAAGRRRALQRKSAD